MKPPLAYSWKLVKFLLLAVTMVLVFAQCGDEETTEPNGQVLNDNLKALGHLDQPTPHDPVEIGEAFDEDKTVEGETYRCSVQEYSVAAQFDEQLALNPTTDVIWPGSIVDGATIRTGAYVPITLPRGPITLSISIPNVDVISRTVQNPKLSTVREAISELVDQEVTGETPAYVTLGIEHVYSEQQLDLAMGATLEAGKAGIKSQFDFSNLNINSRVLVSFLQVYYTIDIDMPEEPGDFFASSVSWGQLQGQMSGDISPMVTSTVAYGRMAMFSVESRYQSTEVSRAFELSIPKIQAGVSLDTEYEKIINNSTIKATIIGGSGSDAVGIINGVEGLTRYILEGGKFDRDSPAAPISYKLRYVSDFAICNMCLATNYFVRQCRQLKPGRIGIYCDAAYVARFYVSWELNGERTSAIGSGNIAVGQMKFIDIPEEAVDIDLHVQKMTWPLPATWGTIFTCRLPSPSVCCYRVKGTTLNSYAVSAPDLCTEMDPWECDCY